MESPEYITIREINDWMDAGLVFSFKSMTHDDKRPKQSGRFMTGSEAIALKHEDTLEDYEKIENTEGASSQHETVIRATKDPKHKYHWTRNIRMCIGKKPIGTPLKIHIDLLVRFNGRKVILP